MNLKQKIIEIRKEVEHLQKDTQGYGYKYVSEDKVIFAIKDKMNELGILLVPSVENHTRTEFAYKNKKNQDVIENVISGDIVFTWYDSESKEELIVPFALYGQKQDAAQAFGSGLTYSNRYFLLKFFQVATNENDPDKVRSNQKEKEDKEYAKSNERMKTNLLDKLELECPNEEERRTMLTKTLKYFNTSWKTLDLHTIPEQVFIDKFVELKDQ